ncbi:hypothetical protein [Fuerstiella marisgermanici]|uniref:Lipoprotein n=1 Tax=Fuerstiella marisgermanici TaxID=1891926 RepID=A0A1P8WRZ4_9PLAN|nr:hypothetical protein [Fuerstiella marisgermanici]APZ96808.1 hypothetical protein Fuma_06482 [Fuerstiella marisgermanici]
MKGRTTILVCLIAALTTVTGCSQPESRQARLSRRTATAPPVDPRIDHYEWAKRLKSLPSDGAIQQVSANPGSSTSIPIPIPQHIAATGVRFALTVDQQSGLAWLQSQGGDSGSSGATHGPWKLNQPDVAHLLHSLTTPPATVAENP